MVNQYDTKTNTLSSSLSSGRLHYSYRPLTRAIETYEYELSYGENFHTLSAIIFGSDTYYWVLADLNPPLDAFSLKPGDVVVLPTKLANQSVDNQKFFY